MIRVRNTRVEDAPGIVDVQRRAFKDSPDMKIWQEHELRAHVKVYPEGQFVAVDDTRNDLVVGSATSMRVRAAVAKRAHTWREVTGGSMLANHDPRGEILYGVDVSVRPAYRKLGVGRMLYDARLALLEKSDCEGFAGGGRIPNYHHFAKFMTPDDYVALVEKRLIRDPVLNFQFGNGMKVLEVMPNYLGDTSSGGYATLIYLPNPAKYPDARPKRRAPPRHAAPPDAINDA